MVAGLNGNGDVRLIGLTKRYGDAVAVESVDLTIGKGEFFSILGPSGSGKTTTMMMIAGFVSPSSGEVMLDGRLVTELPPQRRGLGVVFQNYALFPHLTVEENIAFALEVRGVPKRDIARRVGTMMELVHLAGYGARLPKQLSGGQQQRVALARALVFEPRVLLMDEPLAALDKRLRDHMRAEIRHLHRHLGVTVVYVTHDQEEALSLSDRIAIINRGRIEQVDAPRNLYDRPCTRFVAEFLGESNFLNGTAELRGPTGIDCVAADWRVAGIPAERIMNGSAVVAAVRPERISLLESARDDLNCVVGTVEEITYSGDALTYSVAVGSERLRCNMPYQGGLPEIAFGAKVTLAWRREDTRVFRVHSDAA